ncbi:MAG TPA: DinB family protein [Thermomicrobiaceae bacterium]|nr:DinB family protein [Thermomicrobiaceae bacterium]
MNDGLIDAFRHNAWATSQVLQICGELTPSRLATTVPGTYGNIIDTLRHLISSEANYWARLSGEQPSWDRRAEDAPGLTELAARNDELATRWQRFLARPFDAERTFAIAWHDGGIRDVPAGVVLMQAIHHGNDHRTQICTTLTILDVPAPELGLWDYAEATDRARRRVI